VDNDIKSAQLTTDNTEKAKLYKDAQETIWKDAPWAPLVVEKLLSANNKKLSGVYVIPDASFNFTDVDLK
jgi:glutathione transport system substrate-binding protein